MQEIGTHYSWRGFDFSRPVGIDDETVVTFVAHDKHAGFSLSICIDECGDWASGVRPWVLDQIREMQANLRRFHLIHETPRTVDERPAIELEYTTVAHGGVKMRQIQLYVFADSRALIVTATSTDGRHEAARKAFEEFQRTIRVVDRGPSSSPSG